MAAVDLAYIAKRSPEKRAHLTKLRALIVETTPEATVAIKWGIPTYALDGKNVCGIAAAKGHVSIDLWAPVGTLSDPKGRLTGSGTANRVLRVRGEDDIDAASIRRWLKAVARRRATP